MCVCVCVYVCAFFHIHTFPSTHTHTHGHTHVHSLTHPHPHWNKHDWFLQARLTWKKSHTHAHIYHTHVHSLTHTHTYIHTHVHSLTHPHLHRSKHDWFLQAGLTWKKSTMRLNVGRLDASGLQHSSISSLNCRAYSTCKHICEVRVYVCVCVCGGGGGMCMCVHACVHARTHFGGLTKCVWEI